MNFVGCCFIQSSYGVSICKPLSINSESEFLLTVYTLMYCDQKSVGDCVGVETVLSLEETEFLSTLSVLEQPAKIEHTIHTNKILTL